METIYEGVVVTSCHPEFPIGMIVRSQSVDEELGYKWFLVKLATGVYRNVIVKDVKQVTGEGNGKS